MNLEIVTTARSIASYRGRTLSDIRNAIDGPPLTISELAYAMGFSHEKVRIDIAQGHLGAYTVGLRARLSYRIELAEAQRYLRSLGF
jgi:hypothetical protein